MSLTLLKNKLLPAVFNKYGSKFVECEIDSTSVGKDQFQSNVVFVTAIVEDNGQLVKIPLVVKFEPFCESLREYLNTDVQFYNEVLMYKEILPFLNKKNIIEDTFAKFYHGVGKVGRSDNNVVVIQDLRPSGYVLAEEKAFIDYEHLSLAMERLGKFHALSFAAKQQVPEEFYKLADSLKETSWIESSKTYHPIIKACMHRAIDPLIEQGKQVQVLRRLLDRIDDSVVKFMLELVTPVEPLSVICHGDFCRNNILFKYNCGKPVDVKFFDIATARYSTPVVDIAFFLFLNSSKDVRRAHWDDLLKVYHRALSTTVPGTITPSLDDIKKELLLKAIYGFVHCSFFLPVMLYENPFENGFENTMGMSEEDLNIQHTSVGGEEGTLLLSSMVEELLDRGCLTLQHPFLHTI